MARIVFNFARMRLDYELRALSTAVASLEEHLRIAVEWEVDGILERLKADWDDDEAVSRLAADEIADLRDGVFPRLFRGSQVVVISATFEDCVKELFVVAKRTRKVETAFARRRGEGLIDRCERVFRDSLGYELWDQRTIHELKLLMEARNSYAHSAGRLDDATRTRLNAAITSEGAALLEVHGYLVPTAEYLQQALAIVVKSVNELAEQVMPGAAAISLTDGEAPR